MKTLVKNYDHPESIKVVLFLGLSVLLNGCVGMNSEFGCNAKAGDSCIPVSQVNAMASQGYYQNQDSNGSYGAMRRTSYPIQAGTTQGYRVNTPKPGEPVRFSESVQRIWIAPYRDADDNYHEPSFVYSVLKPAHWIGQPAKAVVSDHEDD